MPANQLTNSGLTIQTLTEIVGELETGLKTIYGQNINLDPNTPDGQLVHIIAQAKADILELINQVFSSFDPDQAVGVNLDRRCALNSIRRAGGTYTLQTLGVTADRALTLPGLDNSLNPFTVQDAQGNRYQLVSGYSFASAGTADILFQSLEIGAVTPALNSITTVVTITLGVTAVNNPTPPNSVGVPEETDAALRTRRTRSVSIPSKGYLDGLIGSLLDLDSVTQVEVFENVTNVTDSRGIPAHSIWVVVAGGTAEDIANVIYIKRSLGCGMRGAVEVAITQADNLITTIKFDRPIAQDLYISFNVAAIYGVIDLDYLRSQILSRVSYRINQPADTATIVKLVKEIYPNASVSEEGVSADGITYEPLILTNTVQHQFNIAFLDINGTVS